MEDFEKTIQDYREGRINQDIFFEVCEKNYRNRILGFLSTQAVKQDQIEDLYQELLIRFHKAIRLTKSINNFNAWILKVARNTALDYLRTTGNRPISQREIPVETTSRGPGPKTENIKKEIPYIVDQALDGLKPEYRELIYLRFHNNLGLKEISSITGLPLSTIQNRIEKALNLLSAVVQSLAPDK